MIKDFVDFEAFKKSRILVKELARYVILPKFRRDPVLVTQMRKSMLSVYANFGEGFERNGNREFIQFLSVSKGSVGELRGHLLYAEDVGLLEPGQRMNLDPLATEAARCLGGLMRYLQTSEMRGVKFSRHD